MRFSKISVTKNEVRLVRTTTSETGATEEIELKSPERPLSTFVDALQAFKSYVRDLLPFSVKDDQLTITTLSLSEDTNRLRGLIVTGTVPVPKAYNKPVVLNTPLVREGGENASADAFVLSDDVLTLIALAEDEATRYAKGERVQLELISRSETTSPNSKDFNERAAAAEVASTRKPKGKKKGRDFIPGVGDVANPDATEQVTDDHLRQLLLSVERDVPVDAINQWTSSDRDAAHRWAVMRQREIIGALKDDEKMPAEPPCVLKSATLPLVADAWTDPKPRRVTHAAVEEVKVAAGTANDKATHSRRFVH